VPKPKPTPEGAVLRFFRFAEGLDENELAAENGLAEQTVGRLEMGKVGMPLERLVKLLAPWKVPREAIETALFSHQLAHPPAGPRAPTAPTEEESRVIDGAAAAAGSAVAKATRARMTRDGHRRHARQHRRWAEATWSRLARLPEKPQEEAIEELLGDPRSWALAERLALASETAAADRASEALRLARLSLRVVAASPGPELWLLRLGGVCEPFLANALRVGGDLPASETSFDRAEDLWKRGAGGDPGGVLDGSRRPDLKASLLMNQGHCQEAIALLDRELKGASTAQARGRLLMKKARAWEIAGEYEASLEVLAHAEPLIAVQRELRLLFLHRFTSASNLCHLERYKAAEPLVPLVEALAAGLDNELDGVRARWLRGRACAGLGKPQEALAAMAQVCRYFRDKEIAYDYALAILEVAVIHLDEGRTQLVRVLAEEMLWIFRGQKVHKEALAALALFCRAAEAEEVKAEWTRRLVKYLYRAQYNPDLRFEA